MPATHFVLPVEPGAHQYVARSEAKDVLNLEVDEKAFQALAPKMGRTQPLVK